MSARASDQTIPVRLFQTSLATTLGSELLNTWLEEELRLRSEATSSGRGVLISGRDASVAGRGALSSGREFSRPAIFSGRESVTYFANLLGIVGIYVFQTPCFPRLLFALT